MADNPKVDREWEKKWWPTPEPAPPPKPDKK